MGNVVLCRDEISSCLYRGMGSLAGTVSYSDALSARRRYKTMIKNY
jgi:hypothetical protein